MELNRKLKFLCSFWICLSTLDAGGVMFQVIPDSTLQDTITSVRLDEVVVKASRFNTKIKTVPGSVQLLRKDKFQKIELAGLSEVVNSIPGVYMQSGGFQTSRLTIRGIGSRNPYGSGRIRAFYDNIPLSSGDGTTIIEDIEPVFIEKAEIIKGPNSAWYGAGIGGAVRFFSPAPVDKAAIQLFFGTGSFGSYKVGGISKVPYRNASINIGVSRVSSNAFRQNSNYYRNSFFLSGAIGSNVKINYLFHVSDVNTHIPSSLDENTYLSNPQLAASNWLKIGGYKKYKRVLGGIRTENNLKSSIVNSFSISGSLNDPYELRPFNILDDNSKTFSVQENITISGSFYTLSIGGEWLHENYQWRILQNNSLIEQQKAREKRNQVNSYVAMQVDVFSSLLVSISVNLNRTQYTITDLFEDSIDYSGITKGRYALSPKVGFSYPLSNDITLYSSFGHGFSNPTVEESLNSEGFLNTNLKPEQGWGFDIGLRAYILKKSVWLDLTYYNIQLKDLLVTKRLSEELFSGENAGDASFHGFELMAQFQPLQRFRADLSFQQSTNRFTHFISENDYSGKKLPGIPSFIVNSDFRFNLVRLLFFNLNLNYYGKQYLNDDNTRESKSWKTVDLKMINSFKLYKKLIEIQIGIKNLFNEQYASMILVNAPSIGTNQPRYYYPGLPRNYFFNLGFNF